MELFDGLEVFYNQRRRHSTLWQISPAAFERRLALVTSEGHMLRLRIPFIVVLAALCAGTAQAQVDTGSILGTIRDKSGAVVPGATVSVREATTNALTTLIADAAGNYVATPLRIGTYSVSVELAGFKTETREGIVLRVQDRLRLDFELEPGDIKESVVVTGEAPLVQSETSSLGEVVDTRQIVGLPLNGRNYIDLATLTSGVIRTAEGSNGNVNATFVVNGTRGGQNNYLLDGIDNNSNDGGEAVAVHQRGRDRGVQGPDEQLLSGVRPLWRRGDQRLPQVRGQHRERERLLFPARRVVRRSWLLRGPELREGAVPLPAVRWHGGRSDPEGQDILLRGLPGHPPPERRHGDLLGADRRAAPRRLLRRGEQHHLRPADRGAVSRQRDPGRPFRSPRRRTSSTSTRIRTRMGSRTTIW